MKTIIAALAAILLAAPAAAEDHQEREPDTPIVEESDQPEPPARVILGVDCSKPLTISLPDDVLIECE